MIVATGENVLVKPIKVKDKTEGGIILQLDENDRPTTGLVISIGTGVKSLEVDNKVMFGPYTGKDIEHEGEKYLLVKESEVLATY